MDWKIVVSANLGAREMPYKLIGSISSNLGLSSRLNLCRLTTLNEAALEKDIDMIWTVQPVIDSSNAWHDFLNAHQSHQKYQTMIYISL